jgi:hypothetical protein
MARIDFGNHEVPLGERDFPADEAEEYDELERTIYPDRRMTGLDQPVQAVVWARFGGDVDLAALHADRLVHTFAKPPSWALALNGARRRGWTDFDPRTVH